MREKLTDIFGVEPKVGDKIAAGMSYGQSSVLRVGEIIGIKDNAGKYSTTTWSMRVKWTHNGSEHQWGVKESSILVKSNYSYAKFVILPAELVAQHPDDIMRD